MKKLLLFLSPLFAFAASGNGDYDIVPRTVNFIIFVAILYYFIATPIKNFFKNRTTSISLKLDDIQNKLAQSKAKKFNAMKQLELAKANAASAVANAKKEAEILVRDIEQDSKDELLLLEKHFDEQKQYELRKMEKEVVSQTLNELFANTNLSQNQVLDIMMKKVS